MALVVVTAAGYALFGFILVSFDKSAYTANTTIESDYDEVLETFRSVGYSVQAVGSSGYHL